MSTYLQKDFWLKTADRALATFAQGFLGVAGADGLGIVSLGVSQVLLISGLAALVSVATSVAYPSRVADTEAETELKELVAEVLKEAEFERILSEGEAQEAASKQPKTRKEAREMGFYDEDKGVG